MKYNEAIDMILDGGKAKCRRWINPHYFIKFNDAGHLVKTCSCPQCGDVNFMFSKLDINGDWIVEKDGVVYEECKGKEMPLNEKYKIDANTVFEAALHEAALRMTRLEQELMLKDEDWLEKKMLCFMNKYLYIHSGMNLETKQGECSNRACPFCFPEEKPELTGDEIEEEKTRINNRLRELFPVDMFIVENLGKAEQEPPEKVTVDNMLSLVFDYGYESTQFWHAWRAKDNRVMDLWDNRRQDNFKKIRQQLTYLVSLQEK